MARWIFPPPCRGIIRIFIINKKEKAAARQPPFLLCMQKWGCRGCLHLFSCHTERRNKAPSSGSRKRQQGRFGDVCSHKPVTNGTSRAPSPTKTCKQSARSIKICKSFPSVAIPFPQKVLGVPRGAFVKRPLGQDQSKTICANDGWHDACRASHFRGLSATRKIAQINP